MQSKIHKFPSKLEISELYQKPIPELLERILSYRPKFLDSNYIKVVNSLSYNYLFNGATGDFIRCGRLLEEDPEYSPYGPEIADIEVSTICSGINGKPCLWCYKSNTPSGNYMTFAVFKSIFKKLPENLTQIAIGIGDLNGNPDLKKIIKWCRNNNLGKIVIPNITINGMQLNDDWGEFLANNCGAVAVSRYQPKRICYIAVQKLINTMNREKKTLKQINIHQLLSEETYNDCFELLDDIQSNEKLNGLHAVIFLGLKPKGIRNSFHPLFDLEKFEKLIKYALERNITIGFDSCISKKFLRIIKDNPNYYELLNMIDTCESMRFSIYINCEGRAFPCSFIEDELGYQGFDINNLENSQEFLDKLWLGKKGEEFRIKLGKSSGNCPQFNI